MWKILKFLLIFLLSISQIFANNWEKWQNQNKQIIQKNNISFENDLFSWIGSYKYDFNFPEWQRWETPQLSLNYNTARVDYLNDSWYWFHFGVESIFRSTKKWQDKLYELDEFAINSQFSYNELVKTSTWNFSGLYNNEVSKYSFTNDTWIVKDIKWNTYYFWENNNFKQIHPENGKTFAWVLSKKVDNFWNETKYSYIKANNNIYLDEVQYTFKDNSPLYKIKINYLQKTFSTESYIYNFKLENYKLLSSIVVQTLVNGSYQDTKKYELSYQDTNSIFPKLIQIKELFQNQVYNTTNFEYYTSWIGINLLKSIENGKWLKTTLEYKASSWYQNTTVPFLLKTLHKITYKDTTTNLEYSNTYDYYGGNFYFDATNIYNRGYTGFNKVKILEDDWSYKYIYFHQSDTDINNSIDAQKGEFNDHISKKWKIYREEEYDQNGKVYTTKITKWIKHMKGNNIYFAIPERITNILWNTLWWHIDSSETFEYDVYWNVTKNIKYGEVTANVWTGDFTDIKNDKKTYEYTYASDSNWVLVNNVCKEKILDNSWNQIFLQKYFYDSLWECNVNKWLLSKKSLFYSETNSYLNQNFTYQNGVLKTESDFEGNITTYNYDTYNLLPSSKINPKNWQEIYSYNYKIQKPISIIDINGINYKYYYDFAWNLTKKTVIDPNSNTEKTLEENSYNFTSIPNYIENKKYWDINNIITSRIYFDGHGREILTKVSSKNANQFSTTKTRYNKKGEKEFVTYPRWENNINFSTIDSSEKWNSLTFDTLWRILSQTNKTWTSSFQYDLLKTTEINQKWVKKENFNDIFWNLVKVIEYNWGQNYTTLYEYNFLNKLSKFTDSKWNIRNFYYDSIGRIKKQEDLHTSNATNFWNIEYTYNNNSLITSKKVMSWEIINYTYDNLWRVLTESFWNESNQFIYDNGSFAKGQLTKTIKNNYSEEYIYNYYGQKIEDKKIYSDSNYTLKYEFDLAGNIRKITYPYNKDTVYTYQNWYVYKVSYQGNEILSNIEYEANNTPKKETYSNWLIQEENFDYEYWYRLISKKAYNDWFKHIRYEFTTSENANFLNISPLVYAHIWDSNLKMKAWVKNIRLVKEWEESIQLIKNWNFEGNSSLNTIWWFGWNNQSWWHVDFSHSLNKASISNNTLEMESNGWVIEVRNTDWGYFWVTPDSIIITPSTKYILEYDYKTEYLWWAKNHWFSVWILTSNSNNISSWEFQAQAYDSWGENNFFQNITYSFDTVWNISNITDTATLWIKKSVNYTYDDLNRLLTSQITDENNISTSTSFSYDSIWNIISNSLIWNYSYNGINPHAVSQFWSGNTLTYDNNWNINNEIINWINKSYIYNSKQELLTSNTQWIQTQYLYDNNSNRVKKENATTLHQYLNNDFEIITNYTQDGSGNTLSEAVSYKYIFLWGKKIFTVENKNNIESIIYNISDHLWWGSIDLSQNGSVLQKSDYYPYGSTRVLERSNTFKNNYLFTGKEFDNESSLQYFEARYYNPNIWRFYSQDRVFLELWNTKRWLQVLQDPQQLNSYSYARNNPIIYVDPSGEIAIAIPALSTFLAKTVELAIGAALVVYTDKVIDKISDSVSYLKKTTESKVQNFVKSGNTNISWWSGWGWGNGKKPKKDNEPNFNKISNQIDKWKAPKDVERIDYKRLWEYEKPHIHFKQNNSALNINWTWKHWWKELLKKEIEWLKSIKWGLPK